MNRYTKPPHHRLIPADFSTSTGTGTWTHVAVTLDGPFSSFKINGNPAGTFTAPFGMTSNSLDLLLGAPHTTIPSSVPCGLLLDDVKIGRLNPANSQQ
ncbi:LamG-like jellyroll fold domain-containing protein [Thermus neutrinimicus]|uniref:LamG-like jellyroll fold domain-containing protein n=1 Tax=Thermus neutrinimicus TaxID=2908149 RepID=UPI003C12B5D1